MPIKTFIKSWVTNTLDTLFSGLTKMQKVSILYAYFKISIKYFLYIKILKKTLTSENIFGYNIKFFDYSIFRILFTEIFFHRIYFFKSCMPSPKIIDCGSNIGMSIFFFKLIYPDAKIVGFEPDKITFDVLSANIKNNRIKGVTLVNSAIGRRNGVIDFYRPIGLGGDLGMSTILSTINYNYEKVKVRTVRLSSYIKENIDLLKMDIEGGEEEAIIEIQKKINQINCLVIELHGKGSKISSILEIEGFKVKIIKPKDTNLPIKILYAYKEARQNQDKLNKELS